MAPTRIGIVAIDGCLTVAVAGLLDVFALANRWVRVRTGRTERAFDIVVLSSAPGEVRSFTGYPIAVDASLADWGGGDVLICSAVAIDPLLALQRSHELVAWLRAPAARPAPVIASVCTGAFFLAEAGLLARRRATTNPLFERTFRDRYPDVDLQLARVLADEGDILTAGTVSAGLQLALHLVERHAGIEIATLTAKTLAVDKNRDSQQPYLIPTRRIEEGDELAVRAQRWIEAHHAQPALSLAIVAKAMAASPRTLQRRFLAATSETPMTYLRLVRLEASKRLLETTEASIDEITWQVGYRDARSFARLFRAHADASPAEYRARFGAPVGAASRRPRP